VVLTPSPVALVPLYWQVVQRLQAAIDTRPKQYAATVALPVAFVVTVVVIYRGGKPLKRRFTNELVEIARTLTIMVVALVDAVLFVIIWRRFDDTVTELEDFATRLVPSTQTAVNLYIAFIALLGTYMLTRVTKRIIRYWSENGRISPHQRELAHHATQFSLFLVVTLFIFGLFGLSPADLFLGAGVLGVVLGLAARKTLANVLSGLIILFGRPFEAGDWIAVGDQEGIVTDISVFNTQVRTFNEEHMLIPNDEVTAQEVINYSKTDRLRLNTEVGIDYDDDVSTAATIAKRTMESCDAVADTPNPDVILEDFGDSEVVLRLRYWIDRPTIQRKLSAQNEVIEAVKAAFEAEDVTIPFPQRELMGRSATDGLRVARADDGRRDEDQRLERAIRAVQPTDADASMTVREPVEAEYGGDGEPDGTDGGPSTADGGPDQRAEAPEDEAIEEPVADRYGGGGEGSDSDPQDAPESAAELVEDDDADLSSPHPRKRGDEVYPETMEDTLDEPVESEQGRRGRHDHPDDGDSVPSDGAGDDQQDGDGAEDDG